MLSRCNGRAASGEGGGLGIRVPQLLGNHVLAGKQSLGDDKTKDHRLIAEGKQIRRAHSNDAEI